MRPLILCLLPALLSGPALAEDPKPTCADRTKVVAHLTGEKWREEPIGAGVSDQGVVVELYVNEHTGTFTLLLTGPEGVSCFVPATTGGMWEFASRGTGL